MGTYLCWRAGSQEHASCKYQRQKSFMIYDSNAGKNISHSLPNIAIYSLWVGIFLLLVALFYYASGAQYDWRAVYAASHDIHHYEKHRFYGLPQSLLLVPHAYLFSLELSDAINLALIAMIPYFVVRKLEMGWKPLLLIYTFPLYWHLLYQVRVNT